jgi:hypothetical protein
MCAGSRRSVLRQHVWSADLVEGGHDGAAARLPRLQVRRDEALAHDGLQDLRQHPLVIVARIVLQRTP